MSDHQLTADMTPGQILHEVLATERETQDLLERAAHLTADAEERRIFERLAAREEAAVRELSREEDRLDGEAFVQRALDC